ncbi:DUF3905 domain-containing protein [Paenibacillus sp. UNC451MF]|uniref:DUF3905 domain-containing protein n=1 Tax=Paenibacillus sp. UNC451MF TaxID=1449063 RepID=UPI00068F4418|nr:DUF3905 domain-containing protein [Paenibacillus sp. UNC451MF]
MSPNEKEQPSRPVSANTRDQSELDPFEINFLPQFLEGRGPRDPFVNSQGVVIGDHDYESDESPLENWSKEVDPSVMSGDEWVHPFKDIGFQTAENKDYFEKGIIPQTGNFAHPDKNVAYPVYSAPLDSEAENGEQPNTDKS